MCCPNQRSGSARLTHTTRRRVECLRTRQSSFHIQTNIENRIMPSKYLVSSVAFHCVGGGEAACECVRSSAIVQRWARGRPCSVALSRTTRLSTRPPCCECLLLCCVSRSLSHTTPHAPHTHTGKKARVRFIAAFHLFLRLASPSSSSPLHPPFQPIPSTRTPCHDNYY